MNKRFKLDRTSQSSDKDFFENFEEEPQTSTNKKPSYTRQTFMISQKNLDTLRDFVHTKKLKDYSYSQRQAIEEALELLFKTVGSIEKRSS